MSDHTTRSAEPVTPTYPVCDHEHQELSLDSLDAVEAIVCRLVHDAALFRFMDADGRAFRLEISGALTHVPEDEDDDGAGDADGVRSSCASILDEVTEGDGEGEAVFACRRCGRRENADGESVDEDDG